jgi:DNA-binding response OmpR family regulator
LRVVTVAGAPVQLSAKEYELLVALAEDPERVFNKEDLLRDMWGFRSLGRTRTLDSHASRLRRKLNRSPETAYVLNVWGVGYRLVATAISRESLAWASGSNDCPYVVLKAQR